MMRTGLVVFALATVACTEAETPAVAPPSAKTFQLANGVELPLLPGVEVVEDCVVNGERPTNKPDLVCLKVPEEDTQNQYTSLLIEKGFEFLGGASIAYWFRWPEKDGCSRQLTISIFPKELKVTTSDSHLLVMDIEPTECPAKT